MESDYSYEVESEEEGENIDYDSCDEEQALTSSVKPTNEYGDPLDYDHVKAGMWVVVLYEEERFIGKVQDKQGVQVNVRCLALPFGINIPQEFEPGEGMIKFTKRTLPQHRLGCTRMENKRGSGSGCTSVSVSFIYVVGGTNFSY